ncbi:flavodoxin family protein, partial [Pseudomonas sp. 69_B]|uniref:flavodoxin family protein n=1 Tax=Pseudomonas sp. 69_B TaxID=2813563 RepID=UPI001A9F1431
QPLTLNHLNYALLALGDRQYPHFCGFARRLQAWLSDRGASSAFGPVEVDNVDQAAVQLWQQQLAQLTGVQPVSAWQPPSFGNWTLVRREQLNPGSQGQPVYLLGLRPEQPASWEAGDLGEILPLNGRARIDAFVHGMAQDAN